MNPECFQAVHEPAEVSRVKAANRRFYDAVAERYEEVDGRRSEALCRWLRQRLRELRSEAPGGRLLDLGTGSGLVMRCSAGIFERRVGMDISPRILAANRAAFDLCLAGDVEHLPFRDASFDVVTCFAVLHHLYDFQSILLEVANVLRPGGVFYSDHDMDAAFYHRFRTCLRIYRWACRSGKRYRHAVPAITEELYEATECHGAGVPSEKIESFLSGAGLSVECRFHWYGLSPLTDFLFGRSEYRRGWAPLLSIQARKAVK